MPHKILEDQYFKQIVHNIQSGLLVLSPEMDIIYTNDIGREIFHVSEIHDTDQSLSACVPDTLATSLEETGTQVAKTGEAIRVDQVIIDDEEGKVIGYTAFPLFESEKTHSVSGIIFLGRDISRITQLEETALKSEKLASMSQLVVTLHHEIRNPLTGVLSTVQILKRQKNLTDAQVEKMHAIIEKEAKKIQLVMDQLNKITEPIIEEWIKGSKFINIEKSL